MQHKFNWTTSQKADSTHLVDDGGCLYWISAPYLTSSQVAAAFREGYDGRLGVVEVTRLTDGEATDHE